MPVYCYKCPECKEQFEIHKPMKDSQRQENCKKCHIELVRDFRRETAVHTPDNWPMESVAAGVGVDQIEEAVEHARSVGVPTEFTSDGNPVFTSAAHRKKFCQAHGLYDRNAGFSDPSPRNK